MTSTGSDGDDTIIGDLVSGLNGDDSLSSTGSNVMLSGGRGDDTLRVIHNPSGPEYNPSPNWKMTGEAGSDSLVLIADVDKSRIDLPQDFSSDVALVGGPGDDTVEVSQIIDLLDFDTFPAVQSKISVTDRVGNNLIKITNDLASGDNSVGGNTYVALGNGADTVSINHTGEGYNYAAVFNDNVDLGGGDDHLSVNSLLGFGQTKIVAGNGNDTLLSVFEMDDANENYSSLSLSQNSGAGNDYVAIDVNDPTGSAGASVVGSLLLGGGNDTLRLSTDNLPKNLLVDGGRGNNDIGVDFSQQKSGSYASEGRLSVITLGGADRLVVDGPGATSTNPFVFAANTGFGNDTVMASEVSAVEIDSGSNDDTIQILTVASTYSYGAEPATNSVAGGQGDDSITIVDKTAPGGVQRVQLVDGGSGDDTIFSRLDGDGNQVVSGGAGDDRIVVRAGDNNNLKGGFGDDTIDASAKSDTILGEGGDDVINGRGGNDYMTGGAGSDLFIFNAFTNFGDDTISDWNGAVDVLDLNGNDTGATGLSEDIDKLSTITQVGADVILSFDATGASITFAGLSGSAITTVADLVGDPLGQLV